MKRSSRDRGSSLPGRSREVDTKKGRSDLHVVTTAMVNLEHAMRASEPPRSWFDDEQCGTLELGVSTAESALPWNAFYEKRDCSSDANHFPPGAVSMDKRSRRAASTAYHFEFHGELPLISNFDEHKDVAVKLSQRLWRQCSSKEVAFIY